MDLPEKVSGLRSFYDLDWPFFAEVTFENESFTHNETMNPANDSFINNSIQSDTNMNNQR